MERNVMIRYNVERTKTKQTKLTKEASKEVRTLNGDSVTVRIMVEMNGRIAYLHVVPVLRPLRRVGLQLLLPRERSHQHVAEPTHERERRALQVVLRYG